MGRLILASTPANGTDLSRATILRGSSFVRCLTLPRREAAAALAGRLLSPRFRREEPAAAAHFLAGLSAVPTSRASLLALLTAAALHRAGAELSRIPAETLVLFGADDRLLLRRAQGELMEQLRSATFDLIERAGHDLSIEQPVVTARRVLEFLLAP